MEFRVPEKKTEVEGEDVAAKKKKALENLKKKSSSGKKKKNADGETEDSDAMEDVKGKISDDENKPKKKIVKRNTKGLSADGKFYFVEKF